MQRLTKGLEEEVYTGLADGTVEGLSHKIAAELDHFATEPDARNVEFSSLPCREYEEVCRELINLRHQLRDCIARMGRYTLIPGGALSLHDDGIFHRSDPSKEYHGWIEREYGTRVVTASTHLNIGVDDPEELLRVWRVIRAEASLFLALTAASPFLNNEVTGRHSTRWDRFPKTPEIVPWFGDYGEYVVWIEGQLASGGMQNIRHLWLATRPNGEAAPYDLNRLELRICDRISQPRRLLAVTALLEGRVLQVLSDPQLDPLRFCDTDALQRIVWDNEEAVSLLSLQGHIRSWDGGVELPVDRAVGRLLDEVRPSARAYEFDCYLDSIEEILDRGNTAQQWLSQVEAGDSIVEVIEQAACEMEEEEKNFLAGD